MQRNLEKTPLVESEYMQDASSYTATRHVRHLFYCAALKKQVKTDDASLLVIDNRHNRCIIVDIGSCRTMPVAAATDYPDEETRSIRKARG